MRLKKILIILIPLALLLLVFSNSQLDTYLLGEARGISEVLPASSIRIPVTRSIAWNSSSAYADSLFQSRGREPFRNWSFEDKMDLPRTLLAHLLANRNVPEVNKQIMSLKPWGKSGSKWLFNPKGGYDFSLSALTTILFLFDAKPELLYPETKTHLIEVLLNDEGEGYSDAVPGTLGRIKDSENHILMAQGSKYLKNRYIMLHGNKEARYNNEINGMETGILDKLNELSGIGLYEFNSVPYLGYTLAALLNLEAFGSGKVQSASREVLDYLCFSYAIGSYQFKYYPPFRRRYERAKNSSLSKDYQTVMMKTWLSFHPAIKFNDQTGRGESHALIAACMPYRPADKVVEMIFDKGNGYFVKMGHGPKSSPEIYSAGKKYLISAGGVNRGRNSIIVARPICLFLNDSAQDLSAVIHLSGPGKDFMNWNNTGVYRNFACTAGPVFIPSTCKPVAQKGNWTAFSLKDSISMVVYSTEKLGLMAVVEGVQQNNLMEAILLANPNPEQLNQTFQFPGGQKIEYDILAPKNKWVIQAVDGNPLDRDFDKWPLINGEFN